MVSRKSEPKRARGAKSVENHLVDLLILFQVIICLFYTIYPQILYTCNSPTTYRIIIAARNK